ncbi:MAG TPA: ZIP family metal transporter [Steroidobacteraceae bacterium]|nr:ZIP family metal transporter [Steroidobacteraceae bacterium]
MSTLSWILLFTALGGVLSALAASVFLLMSASRRAAWLPHLISFATGALLGAALLKLLPNAIEAAGLSNVHLIGFALVAGIFAFFVLEKLVIWRHCHQHDCDSHVPHLDPRDRASGILILTGDAIHNALDGVLIAAAFMLDVGLGILTSIAVIAHEIPQEVGDLAILLNSGMSRARAFALNLLTSLTSIVGGLLAFFALEQAQQAVPYALAVAASCFLYVAVADLIPGLHRRVEVRASVHQMVLIAVGIAVIVLTDRLTGMH